METVSELEYWCRILLEKDEDGNYLNGERQVEACKIVNRLRGTEKVVDTEYEIIQPKQITNGESHT